jgi:hypothetical protein
VLEQRFYASYWGMLFIVQCGRQYFVVQQLRDTQGSIWLLEPTASEIKILLMVLKWDTFTNVVVTAGIEAEIKNAFQEDYATFDFVHVFH